MKTNTNTRTIQTPFSSTKAFEVLGSVLGRMTDVQWENSGRMDKYWKFADVKRAANGNVYLEISGEKSKLDGANSRGCPKWLANGFYDMNDEAILQFFAAKIKHIMLEDLKDANITNGWRRDYEAFHTAYLNYKEQITVAEVYCIYDILKRRSLQKFTAEVAKAVYGIQKSKEEVAKELARQTALAELAAELKALTEALQKDKAEAIALIEQEYSARVTELYASYGAEAKLTSDQLVDYYYNLNDAVRQNAVRQKKFSVMGIVMATAQQRAEALVKTLDKWVDEEA